MIKIQLDARAIEALIGDDTDVAIEVRNSVVQAFAKRHLKGVINVEMLKRLVDEEAEAIRLAARAAFADEIADVKTGAFGGHKLTLKPEVEKTIRLKAQMAIASVTDKIIKEELPKAVEDAKALTEDYFRRMSREEFDKKIDESVRRVLSEGVLKK